MISISFKDFKIHEFSRHEKPFKQIKPIYLHSIYYKCIHLNNQDQSEDQYQGSILKISKYWPSVVKHRFVYKLEKQSSCPKFFNKSSHVSTKPDINCQIQLEIVKNDFIANWNIVDTNRSNFFTWFFLRKIFQNPTNIQPA